MVNINERSLVLLKPDAVCRGITGDIISRFERTGLKIVGMKMIFATDAQLEEHYFKDDEWLVRVGKGIIENKGYAKDHDPKAAGQEIVDSLVKDMKLSPIVAMAVEGVNAVRNVKRLVGPTDIQQAQPGTVRGDYSHDTYGLANVSDRPIITIAHCSGEVDEAQHELKIWFKDDELHTYDKVDSAMHYRKL